ncbi:MAG: glycosyltransferase family 1 protein [Verrucomicrobiales bacterium]|nr:glycosyltransferase family 1 protein [Verrucomicrobiales bacterium]
MTALTINARYKNRPLTGVERFAFEVEKQLRNRKGLEISEVDPGRELSGLKGHSWEQFVLPSRVKGSDILFSPCNTGPVSVANQLVVIHDAAVWDYPEGFSRSFGTVYRNLLPALAKRCRWVATVSEFSRGRLAEHLKVPEKRILVLGNATSSDFCPPENRTSDGPPRFFCVSSLDPRKNFVRLIKVWEQLRKSGKLPEGTTLRIAGGANPRNFSAIEFEDSPSVKWLGRISDEELVAEYQSATAFIFPSLYEGFGLPPLEALACGCPVLLSNRASLPEVGGPESEGAVIYFDPDDESSMGSSIEQMIGFSGAEIDRISRKAIERSQKFSWESVADRLVTALK